MQGCAPSPRPSTRPRRRSPHPAPGSVAVPASIALGGSARRPVQPRRPGWRRSLGGSKTRTQLGHVGLELGDAVARRGQTVIDAVSGHTGRSGGQQLAVTVAGGSGLAFGPGCFLLCDVSPPVGRGQRGLQFGEALGELPGAGESLSFGETGPVGGLAVRVRVVETLPRHQPLTSP